jgi:hypothetical protein
MSGVVPRDTDLSATSAVLQFQQAAIKSSIAQYYGYKAAYWTDPQQKNITHLSVGHDPSIQLQSLSITGLIPKTTYHAAIVPFRRVYAAFGYTKFEYGDESQTVLFTTSK